MRKTLIAIAAVAAISPAAADEFLTHDDRMMGLALAEWAGMNCGPLIPMEDYFRTLSETEEIGDETMDPYRRRIRAQMDKAATREIACQSVEQAMAENSE